MKRPKITRAGSDANIPFAGIEPKGAGGLLVSKPTDEIGVSIGVDCQSEVLTFEVESVLALTLSQEQAHRIACALYDGITAIRRASEPNHGQDEVRAERFAEALDSASQGVRGDLIAFCFGEILADICERMAPKGREDHAMDQLLVLLGGFARNAYADRRKSKH